jgi:hypothetical protein
MSILLSFRVRLVPCLCCYEVDKITQLTHEVIRLMDLQVEVLRGTLAEMTVSQVQEYAERRDASNNFVWN